MTKSIYEINNNIICEVSPDGTKFWYKNRKLHCEDRPAIEYPDGTKHWYLNGKMHREDGPALEYPNGTKLWYLNGKQHREDGPAIEWFDGRKAWYLNDKLIAEGECPENWNELVLLAQVEQVMND